MTESGGISRVELSGYKSIRHLDLELKPLNVLIGPNGAGKSNFISFFTFLNRILTQSLQLYVSRKGTAEAFLHFGSRETAQIKAHLIFSQNGYRIKLVPTDDGQLVFEEEEVEFFGHGSGKKPYYESQEPPSLFESRLKEKERGVASYVKDHLERFQVYHFHDTSDTASVKKVCNVHDDTRLRPQGENLAAFLYSIEGTPEYEMIVKTIRRVAPFFHDFILVPDKNNRDQIRLRWKHKGSREYFDANGLSDGTLRFICLATLLLQPLQPNQPEVILLDEPELGLHPYALQILAGMLRSASARAQIITSTQSVTLANQFNFGDIIVVEQKDGESLFKRLEKEDVEYWLEDYSVGDIWEKNLIGGTPE